MPGRTWTRFNGYLYRYWKLEALVIALGLLSTPLALATPYLTKIIIDKAYGNRDLGLFFVLAVIAGAIFILSGVITSFSGYLSRRVNRNVQYDLTRDLFRHLQSLSLSFFNSRSTGEHIFRISQDADAVSRFICDTMPQMVTLLPRLLLLLGVVFFLNWKLALLTTMLVPIAYIQPYLFGKWLRETARKNTQRSQGVFKELQETFSHMHLIKAFGKTEESIEKFEKTFSEKMKYDLESAKLSSISGFSGSVLNKALGGVIALYGGYEVIRGTITLGSLTAVMIYLTQLIGLLKSIGTLYETTAVNSVNRHRVAEIFDIKPIMREGEGALGRSIDRGRIEFKNVSFRYKKDISVLKDLSFSIEAGSRAALVGLSGCGKTTILSLILRLYEQENGLVTIDGMDTRKIKLASLRSGISLALQEPYLWNDTVANNILYGADGPAAPEDAMWAARLVEAHEFIMKLPNGYDSGIGEMGCKISEGQKQRIAMARALVKRPRILILDEALASLDSHTEDRIIKNIFSELKGSTVIVVSHRLSTVKNMERVYFLENGSDIKAGTHEELLARNSNYKEIFASQLSRAAEDKILI